MIEKIYLVFCHIAALSGGIYVTNELLKKLEQLAQCSQQMDMIMFHMLRSCYDWVLYMGMILVTYGVALLFDVILSDSIILGVMLKKVSMIAIIGGSITAGIARIATNYITGLGF